MCVAWIEGRKGAIVVSPREGAKDGPHQPYPTARPNGRGSDRPVLPHRRRLPTPQPKREALRVAQAALGLGGHNPRPLGASASGDPLRVGGRSLKTLLIDSTLLAALHPRQVARSAGFPGAAWVRWGSFSVYGVKLHVLCATDGVPISYELAPFRTWRRCA